MNITQLTVINACLASMGEEPINSMAEDNAFINSAKFALEQAVINEQTRGWYFNIEDISIVPDSRDNLYRVAADVIDLVEDNANAGWLALRGVTLYDKTTGANFTGTKPLKVKVIRLLAFEDLPIMARRMIKAAAVLLFQQSYDGDANKIRDAQAEYQTSYTYLNAQHIRAVGANFLPRRGMELRRGHSRLRTHG